MTRDLDAEIRTFSERPTFKERRWAQVEKSDGCWLWLGARDRHGYARCGGELMHRWCYEESVGLIPPGLDLDHLCRNRLCVNPAHMEPVTHGENMRRAPLHSFAATNAAKTRCIQGHAFTPENTGRERGRRYCKTCNRANSQRRRDRVRAAA